MSILSSRSAPAQPLAAALSTSAATILLRHGERALRASDRPGARLCLAALEETQSLGAVFAAQILAEELRSPASRQNKSRRAA